MEWQCLNDQRGQSSWWCNLPARSAAEAERGLRIQYWPDKYGDTLYHAVFQTETGYGNVRETSEQTSLEAAQTWCEAQAEKDWPTIVREERAAYIAAFQNARTL